MENKPKESDSLETLETPDTVVGSSTNTGSTAVDETSLETDGSPAAIEDAPATKKRSFHLREFISSHLNIYLLIFILIVIIAVGITLVGIQRNKKIDTPATISTTPLTA